MIDWGWTITSIAEEMMRLDHLQRLVEHGGAADRDFQPHGPVGMGARTLRRHMRHLLARHPAERTARGRQHEALHRMPLALVEGREDGTVLAVDRDQRATALGNGGNEKRPGRYQTFLVGQRDIGPACGGRQRRRQPGRADDRRHHQIRLALGRLQKPRGPGGHRDARARQRRFQGVIEPLIRRNGQLCTHFPGLLRQKPDIGMPRQRLDLKGLPPAQLGDDIERIAADRPGRAENADASLFACLSA